MLQLHRYELVELLPCGDFGVPPDAEPISLEGPNQRLNADSIKSRIGNEDVCHTCRLRFAPPNVKPKLLVSEMVRKLPSLFRHSRESGHDASGYTTGWKSLCMIHFA